MTAEDVAKQLESLQDAVDKQGALIAGLLAHVAKQDDEIAMLKINLSDLKRREERQDELIEEIQQTAVSKDRRFRTLERHIEEQAQDFIEARKTH